MRASGVRVMFITPSLSTNSLGRTYCLYLLANSLGWESETWSAYGEEVWKPLADDDFAGTCRRTATGGQNSVQELIGAAREVDLVIAVKPVPESLGLAWKVHAMLGVPLVCDIDDPDLEVLLASGSPVKALAKRLVRSRVVRSAKAMRRIAARLPKIVSNPQLQRAHGGTVIPHVRPTPARHAPRDADDLIEIAFVGSVQAHKGLPVLRRAVRALSPGPFRLTVTAKPPVDAEPWERWVGRTSLSEGLRLVEGADVVAIPSLRTTWSRGQLPVKLVDAMMLGACVIVSDIAPLPWAVGSAGLVVRPSSVRALTAALKVLADPDERSRRREALISLADERYTIAANSATFERVCRDAVSARQ